MALICVVCKFKAATKGYVALGISLDKKMGEDFVLECVKNGTSKDDIETVHTSWNIAKSETKKVERGNMRYVSRIFFPFQFFQSGKV